MKDIEDGNTDAIQNIFIDWEDKEKLQVIIVKCFFYWDFFNILWLIFFPVMRKAFQMFDTTKCGFIETLKISTILNTMGQIFDDGELNSLIEEIDPDGKYHKQGSLH